MHVLWRGPERLRAAVALVRGQPAHARGLVLARLGWGVVAFACIGMLAASLPQRYAELLSPRAAGLRAGVALLGIPTGVHVAYNLGIELLGAAVFFAVAAVIFVRRSANVPGIGTSAMLIAFGAALPGTSYALTSGQPIWRIAPGALQALGWCSLLLFALLFPTGEFTPRWTRLLVVPWIVWVAAFFAVADLLTAGRPGAIVASYAVWIAWLGVGAAAQVYRFSWRSTPLARQQTKWVMLGFVGALAGSLLASVGQVLSLGAGQATPTNVLAQGAAVAGLNLSALAIPLTIAIAILRHNLFDIDRLIKLTLVYGLLTAALLVVYVAGVTLTQAGLRLVTGQSDQSTLALVLSTLGIAALFQPLRARIHRAIDRRFYRSRYNTAATLEQFSAHLRSEVSLPRLVDALLHLSAETMQPTHVSLWLAQPLPHEVPHPVAATGERELPR